MRIATSSLIANQVPEFVREDYPTFIAFIEAYYEYLDQQGVDLRSLRDLDTTIDGFIQYFKKELAVNLPAGISVDERFVLQHIKDQYLAKGSEGSFKLLFRLLYNKNVTLNYPGRQMLRASDGRWQQDVSLFVKVSLGTPDLVDGKLVDIVKPNRTFKILVDRRQYVEVEIDRVVQLSPDVYELFIDRKFFGDIEVGDQIRYKEVFAGTIVSTTSKLKIVGAGTGFKAGQLFELKNGNGVRTIVKITRVDNNGGILSAEFIKFGIGYDTDFTLNINSTNDYYTSTNDSLLSSVTITPGAVRVTEALRGFSEQGFINKADYAFTFTTIGGITTQEFYFDGTYCGEVLREYSVEARAGVQVSVEQDANLKVSLGALAKYPGYFSSNDGFLDDAIFIQDSKYYQAFSYVLKIDERLASYKTAVKTMVHPSGTALFGEFEISNNFDISVDLESLVKILALSFKDTISIDDIRISSELLIQIEKQINDEIFATETMIRDIEKVLEDTLDQQTETLVFDVTKPLADSITTPTDDKAILTGKVLADTLPEQTDSITAKDIGKVLADSQNISNDYLTIQTDKYISTALGYQEDITEPDDGYVAMNPYSEGGYFSIHPIIYDNTVESKFGDTVDTNLYT